VVVLVVGVGLLVGVGGGAIVPFRVLVAGEVETLGGLVNRVPARLIELLRVLAGVVLGILPGRLPLVELR